MKLVEIRIQNFRRLVDVTIKVDDGQTIFVGPNNSGKTSATTIFRNFLKGRPFSVYDFSVSTIEQFHSFVANSGEGPLPEIHLDLWFSIDPAHIEFGVFYQLLPRLDEIDKVGIRLSFAVKDETKLYADYMAAYPPKQDTGSRKSLFEYLALDNNLKNYWTTKYAALEQTSESEDKADPAHNTIPLNPAEGREILNQLLRVEFIDAQRNLHDDDNSRSNKVSAAFASYYKYHLEKPETAEASRKVIDENNKSLTEHYHQQFKPLMQLLQGLGVPTINDRSLKLLSNISPHEALAGNTELFYTRAPNGEDSEHSLPESYNGLGFKNLIYMAIQAMHFYSQWVNTAEKRPSCLVIFIEEPEAHLHVQVQRTFIQNILNVLGETQKKEGAVSPIPQLVITTHSSHILDAAEFEKIRYFRRDLNKPRANECAISEISTVENLQNFRPDPIGTDTKLISREEAMRFLQKYLRLTHCDLFFADAVILVEGAVERLLLPEIIDKDVERLKSNYLSILEVGGAYAHRFEGLLDFLGIPHLIITDLDSVDPEPNGTACRADKENAVTSNPTLKKLLEQNAISELLKLDKPDEKSSAKDRYIAFQNPITVKLGTDTQNLIPRTLEEAIAYENFELLQSGELCFGSLELSGDLESHYQQTYEYVQSGKLEKTTFALDLLSSDSDWKAPSYIVDGLRWLEARLNRGS